MKDSTFSPEDKGALLLKNMSPEVVEIVLSQLSAEHRDKLRVRMQRVDPTGSGLDEVLAEIAESWNCGKSQTSAKASSARRSRAAENPSDDDPFPTEAEIARDPVDALTIVEVDALARALGEEKPATVSLLLNHMELQRAGEVYRKLPGDLRREVSIQLSAGADCALEVVRRIAQAILLKCKLLKHKPAAPDPNARFNKIAEMLRMLEKQERMDILTTMEERDAATAATIKALLYRFDDVLRMDNRSVQRLLTEIDTKALAVALKDASQEIKDKFLSNMSKRAQEALAEEMEFSGNIPPVQVQQSQKSITDVVQRLDQANEITLT